MGFSNGQCFVVSCWVSGSYVRAFDQEGPHKRMLPDHIVLGIPSEQQSEIYMSSEECAMEHRQIYRYVLIGIEKFIMHGADTRQKRWFVIFNVKIVPSTL